VFRPTRSDPAEKTWVALDPRALRLWFRYHGSEVELTRVTRVAMRPPPSQAVGDGRPLETVSGAWVEVRDEAGRCLWRNFLHDPFGTIIEGLAPGGRHTNAYRDNPQGVLVLVVPELEHAASVALVSSPLERGRRHEPARDLAVFELRQR
jgi:hypothetical protein